MKARWKARKDETEETKMVWDLSIFSEWFSPGRCVWSSFSIGPTPRRHPRPHAFHHTPPHPRTTPRSCRENPALLANHLQVTSRTPARHYPGHVPACWMSKCSPVQIPADVPGTDSRPAFQGPGPGMPAYGPAYGPHLWTWPALTRGQLPDISLGVSNRH